MQVKKQYRTKPQPSFEEREDLKERAYRFTTLAALSRVFRVRAPQISQAFDGTQPTLMNKLKLYIESYESRQQAA